MKAAAIFDSGALASVDLFQGLAPAALADVGALARLRRLPKDTRIFAQGDPAERCYVLSEGGIRIAQSGSDGAQVVVRFIGPGETFGTVALFTDRRYPADAVAVSHSIEVSWAEAALHDLIRRYPQIALNLVGIIGRRLQEVQERLREASTWRVEARVAQALLRLADQAGQSGSAGTKIDFPLTRRDIAEMSGTTLFTASRILAAWEKAELIVSDHQRVTIKKHAGIRRIADELPD